jgi:hypothetical protein
MFVFRSRIERGDNGWFAQIVKVRPEESFRVVWQDGPFAAKKTVLAIAAETKLPLLLAAEERDLDDH